MRVQRRVVACQHFCAGGRGGNAGGWVVGWSVPVMSCMMINMHDLRCICMHVSHKTLAFYLYLPTQDVFERRD